MRKTHRFIIEGSLNGKKVLLYQDVKHWFWEIPRAYLAKDWYSVNGKKYKIISGVFEEVIEV